MKLSGLFSSLLVCGAILPLSAQDAPPASPPEPPPASEGRPRPNGFKFDGGGGIRLLPGMPMMLGSRPGQPAKFGAVDPSHYKALPLLLRSDVRGELGISIAQREAIDDLVKKDTPLGGPGRPIRIEARGDTDPREQLQKMIAESLDSSNKAAEAILRPAQIKRLRELDLRWRGALALGDRIVAEFLELTPEQREQAAELLQEYRQKQQEITMEVYKDFMQTQENSDKGDNGEERRAVAVRLRIPDRQEMTPEQRAKFDSMDEKIEKIRKEQNAKALALLTPEQATKWKQMQGKAFAYRAHD
jgi:hypothetical protein